MSMKFTRQLANLLCCNSAQVKLILFKSWHVISIPSFLRLPCICSPSMQHALVAYCRPSARAISFFLTWWWAPTFVDSSASTSSFQASSLRKMVGICRRNLQFPIFFYSMTTEHWWHKQWITTLRSYTHAQEYAHLLPAPATRRSSRQTLATSLLLQTAVLSCNWQYTA